MEPKKKLETTELEVLHGVGPKTKISLYSLGIRSILDVLLFLPSFLIDKTQLSDIKKVNSGEKALFIGTIITIFKTRGAKPSLILKVDIGSSILQIRFLNKIIVYSYLKKGDKIRFSGILYRRNNLCEMIHPETEVIKNNPELELITPYYKIKKYFSQNKFRQIIKKAFMHMDGKNLLPEILDSNFLLKSKLPNFLKALRDCHFPSGKEFDNADENFNHARKRFVIEELLAQKVKLSDAHSLLETHQSYPITIDKYEEKKLLEKLDFSLTNSQKEALLDIKKSFLSRTQSMRLIQGDVGSGKTILAILACFYVVKSGFQAAVMVPTEILCGQHLKSFNSILKSFDVIIETLQSKHSAAKKKEILSEVNKGYVQILIGTHSLIQKDVRFSKLGLIIIDEQHKFGVQQRTLLTEKHNSNLLYPHQIFLSATPIPRSLSLVLYQGLDYTVINELPKNRKNVITTLINNSSREKLYKEIEKILYEEGQVYWVCSCIDHTETLEAEYVKGIYENLKLKFPDRNISCLHGRVTPEQNNKTLLDFSIGKIQLLVCTTMIEVGVDVENATCIVIEDSDRFGLSQLHQLRGRVGRGSKDSFCYLIYKDNLNDKALKRLQVMKDRNNGFKIAEEDLKLRGAGDYLGVKQSGENKNFKIASAEDAINNFDFIKKIGNETFLVDTNKRKELISRWDVTRESRINI